MTNGDKIRQMSNEELIKVVRPCNNCIYQEPCDIDITLNETFDCWKGIKAYLDMEIQE